MEEFNMNVTSYYTPKVLKKLSVHDYDHPMVRTITNDNYANKIYFKDKLYVNGKYIANHPKIKTPLSKQAVPHEVIAKGDFIELIWQGGFYVACLPVAVGMLGFMFL
jgi:hypothetical protein